jgi:hypothetical protein
MNPRTILQAALLSMAAAATSAWGDGLEPFEATYAWMWHGMTVAVSSLKLQRQQDVWVYASRSEPRGLGRMFPERPVQKSTMRVVGSEVQPLSYQADDGTSSTRQDADVTFDWEHDRASGVYDDVKVDMPLQKGIQDDLSIQIALMAGLLAGHVPESLQLIDKNTVREYRYSREAQETIATALGKMETVIFKSQKAGSPRVTRFWVAPARGYIPMRVEQKKGDEVQWTMEIRSLKRD